MSEFESGAGGPPPPPPPPPSPPPSPSPSPPPAPVRPETPHSFEFSFGATLSRTLSCFGKNLIPFLLVGLVVAVPLGLVMLGAGAAVWHGEDEWMLGSGEHDPSFFWDRTQAEMGFIGPLISTGLPIVLQALLTLAVFHYLGGSKLQLGRSLSRGLGSMLNAALVAILTYLGVVAALMPLTMVVTPFIALESEIGIQVLAVAGGIASVMVFCVFFVSVQACVVERLGPTRGMSRSTILTRGARWQVFAMLMLVWGAGLVVVLVLQRVVVGDEPATWASARLGILITVATSALFGVFHAVAAAVFYHALRDAKEGVGIDELVRVFD